jgi:hypothetical protein
MQRLRGTYFVWLSTSSLLGSSLLFRVHQDCIWLCSIAQVVIWEWPLQSIVDLAWTLLLCMLLRLCSHWITCISKRLFLEIWSQTMLSSMRMVMRCWQTLVCQSRALALTTHPALSAVQLLTWLLKCLEGQDTQRVSIGIYWVC